MPKGSLGLVVDCCGLAAVLLLSLHAILAPNDVLALTAIATALCFWLAFRTVIIYGCGDRLWPAPAAMFLLATLILGHVGGFLHYANPISVPQLGSIRLIWGFNIGYLGLALGTYAYVKLHGINTAKLVDAYYERKPVVPLSNRPLLLPSLVILFLAIAVSMVLLQGSLPIFKSIFLLLTGKFSALNLAGIASRSLNKTAGAYRFQGYLEQMRISIIPMLSLLYLSFASMTRDRAYKIAAWFTVGLTCLMLVAILERGPIFVYFIQLMVLGMLLKRPRITLKGVASGLAGAILVYFALTQLLGRSAAQSFGEAMSLQGIGAVQRIFLTSSEVNARTMATFPEVLPFSKGAMLWDNVIAILPGQHETMSRKMFVLFYGGTTAGSASMHSFAEMWINDGYLGIVIGSIFFGLFFQWINVKIMTLDPKTPLALSTWAFVAFLFGSWSLGGLSTPTDRGLLSALILYAILRGFETIQKRTFHIQTPPALPGTGETRLPASRESRQDVQLEPALDATLSS
jgi:hypothetical protein